MEETKAKDEEEIKAKETEVETSSSEKNKKEKKDKGSDKKKEAEAKIAEQEVKIAELEAQIAKMKEDELRAAADTENYKKRLRAQKDDAVKYANERIITDLLTPLDNFSRAIEAAESTKDFEAMKQGVVMVEDQLLSTLKTNWGLEVITALGRPFDPNEMEAYSVVEDPNVKEETVVQEFAKGYRLNGKVIRTAKVQVGRPVEK